MDVSLLTIGFWHRYYWYISLLGLETTDNHHSLLELAHTDDGWRFDFLWLRHLLNREAEDE